ncbi:hypothetical protein VFPPC_15600 [Pochonia chlamydosporia 170]|uniref:Uncharacterized protein n=1 Tax=Pochonia chlamydosporia 170 TaxID=1380566 RepID=A0A179FYY5_METCM|nr:hypothetical protein VFPPC_15600 [Pochonia chlamydosporia 170]OAQ70597.2 hypothetical protein VFPPC_15600 [Pochonia chlamydosporia 170]
MSVPDISSLTKLDFTRPGCRGSHCTARDHIVPHRTAQKCTTPHRPVRASELGRGAGVVWSGGSPGRDIQSINLVTISSREALSNCTRAGHGHCIRCSVQCSSCIKKGTTTMD